MADQVIQYIKAHNLTMAKKLYTEDMKETIQKSSGDFILAAVHSAQNHIELRKCVIDEERGFKKEYPTHEEISIREKMEEHDLYAEWANLFKWLMENDLFVKTTGEKLTLLDVAITSLASEEKAYHAFGIYIINNWSKDIDLKAFEKMEFKSKEKKDYIASLLIRNFIGQK